MASNTSKRSAPKADTTTEAPEAEESTTEEEAIETVAPATIEEAVEALKGEDAVSVYSLDMTAAVGALKGGARTGAASKAMGLAKAAGLERPVISELGMQVTDALEATKASRAKAGPKVSDDEAAAIRAALTLATTTAPRLLALMAEFEGVRLSAPAIEAIEAMTDKAATKAAEAKVPGASGGGGGAALARDYKPFSGRKVTLKGRPDVSATLTEAGKLKGITGATAAHTKAMGEEPVSLSMAARTILNSKAIRGPEYWLLAGGEEKGADIGTAALKPAAKR